MLTATDVDHVAVAVTVPASAVAGPGRPPCLKSGVARPFHDAGDRRVV
jgi:hypothetical protein